MFEAVEAHLTTSAVLYKSIQNAITFNAFSINRIF